MIFYSALKVKMNWALKYSTKPITDNFREYSSIITKYSFWLSFPLPHQFLTLFHQIFK